MSAFLCLNPNAKKYAYQIKIYSSYEKKAISKELRLPAIPFISCRDQAPDQILD